MAPGSNGSGPITQATIDEILHCLTDMVTARTPQDLPSELAGQAGLVNLYETLLDLRRMVDALRRGDLSYQSTATGYLPGSIKELQANLRHLTWQAQQLAAGDLTQRVDFMGEFSDAFNAMINKVAETQSKLEELATVDPLTGLLNRRHFFTLARAEWERSQRQGHTLCLMMLDLDHFKRVNDTHGHAQGDAVLTAVAAICADHLRRADLIGRYGGEEIVILLPETRLQAAMAVAERLRAEIAATPVITDKGPIMISTSIGLALSLPHNAPNVASDDGLAQMIVHADDALYRAKSEGRNAVRVYEA